MKNSPLYEEDYGEVRFEGAVQAVDRAIGFASSLAQRVRRYFNRRRIPACGEISYKTSEGGLLTWRLGQT